MHNQPGDAAPVFVDRTGRRRRLTVVAGTAMGLGLLTSLALIAAGLFMDSSVSLPGWSDRVPPLGTGAEERDGFGTLPVEPVPSPVTSTTVPAPTPSRTVASSTAPAATAPAPSAQPTRPGQPGQDRRPTAKPSKSPGKPG